MEFSSQLTNNEKRGIFERSLRDAEKLLFERLIGHGIDPDTFDINGEHNFDVAVLNESINAVKLIRRKLSELNS
jgi:hypothetical protein